MMMPGRKFSTGNYRYGFNGKENDNDVKGEGNQQDYGMRIYDPRLGKFLSLDPLARDYPYYSPYHFAGNSPIKFIDLDGGEPKDYVDNWTPKPMGYFGTNRFVEAADENHSSLMLEEPGLGWIRVQQIYDATTDKHWFVHHNSGTGKYYYYKADDGQHNILTVQITKNGLAIISKGSMVEFETQDAAQARIGKEVAEGFAKFWAVTLGGAIATNGGFLYYAGMALLEDALGVPIINSPDDISRSSTRKSAQAIIPEEKFIYRFDTRSMDEIASDGGFKSWGNDMDLLSHAEGTTIINKTSGYVSTSLDETALKTVVGNQPGYMYKIKMQASGVDVNKALGSKSPYPHEKEFAVPNQINASDIVEVQPINK